MAVCFGLGTCLVDISCFGLELVSPDLLFDGQYYVRTFTSSQLNSFVTEYIFSQRRPVYPSGFCYLTWFDQLNISYDIRCRSVKCLRSFPSVSSVLSVLFDHCNVGMLVSLPQRVSSGYLHVDKYMRLVTMHSMLQRFGKDDRLGGDMVIDQDVIQDALRASGRDPQIVFSDILGKMVVKPGSTVSDQFITTLTRTIQERNAMHRHIDLNINYALDAFAMNKLKNAFPELRLKFAGHVHHPHALAAAARKCEEVICLSRAKYNNRFRVMQGFHAAVKDVGGNLRSHVERKRYSVHSCMPIIDARDSQRFTDTLDYLRTKILRDPQLRRMVLNESLPVDNAKNKTISTRCAESGYSPRDYLMCNNKSQCCTIRAPEMISIHSVYDMTCTDIADSMFIAGATHLHGVMMFDPLILYDDIGVIRDLDCHWMVTRRNGKRYQIKFNFEKDSSFTYVHDYTTYISLVTTSMIRANNGTMYFVEQIDRRMGSIHFKITANRVQRVPACTINHTIWYDQHLRKTRVEYYDYVPGDYPKTPAAIFKRFLFYVPTVLYNHGMEHAYSFTPARFTVNAIYEHLRGANYRFIVNGVDVAAAESIPPNDLYKLAHAIYVKAFCSRYDESTALALILERVQAERVTDNESFVRRLLSYVSSGFGYFSDKPAATECDSLMRRCYMWMAQPRLFDVRIEDAAKFTEYETVVEDTVIEYCCDFATEYLRSRERTSPLNIDDAFASVVENNITELLKPKDSDTTTAEHHGEINVTSGDTTSFTSTGIIPYTVSTCDADLTVIPVPSDGDCLFHSLNYVLGLQTTVDELRHRLSLNSHVNCLVNKHATLELLRTPHAWGDIDVVYLAANEFGTVVCVHQYMNDQLTVMRVVPDKHDGVVHLRLDIRGASAHYQPLEVIDQHTESDVTYQQFSTMTIRERDNYIDEFVRKFQSVADSLKTATEPLPTFVLPTIMRVWYIIRCIKSVYSPYSMFMLIRTAFTLYSGLVRFYHAYGTDKMYVKHPVPVEQKLDLPPEMRVSAIRTRNYLTVVNDGVNKYYNAIPIVSTPVIMPCQPSRIEEDRGAVQRNLTTSVVVSDRPSSPLLPETSTPSRHPTESSVADPSTESFTSVPAIDDDDTQYDADSTLDFALTDYKRKDRFEEFVGRHGLTTRLVAFIEPDNDDYWDQIYNFLWEKELKDIGDDTSLLPNLGLYLNRSAYKLHDIVNASPISIKEPILDLCGSPGGFVDYLLLHNYADITTVSIVDRYARHIRDSGVAIIIGDVRNYVDTRKYNTILADGAVEDSYIDDTVFEAELTIIYANLAKDGLAVIKHSNYFHISDALKESVRQRFTHVELVKPFSSRAGCSEVYFVCQGYTGTNVFYNDCGVAQFVNGINAYVNAYATGISDTIPYDELRNRYRRGFEIRRLNRQLSRLSRRYTDMVANHFCPDLLDPVEWDVDVTPVRYSVPTDEVDGQVDASDVSNNVDSLSDRSELSDTSLSSNTDTPMTPVGEVDDRDKFSDRGDTHVTICSDSQHDDDEFFDAAEVNYLECLHDIDSLVLRSVPVINFNPAVTPVFCQSTDGICSAGKVTVTTNADCDYTKSRYACNNISYGKVYTRDEQLTEVVLVTSMDKVYNDLQWFFFELLAKEVQPTVFEINDFVADLRLTTSVMDRLQKRAGQYPHRFLVTPVSDEVADRLKYYRLSMEKACVLSVDKPEIKGCSVYANWKKKMNSYPVYQPKRLDDVSPLSLMKNAMYEISEYWRVKDRILLDQYTKVYSEIPVIITHTYKTKMRESLEGYGLLNENGDWIVEPMRNRNYEVAFDGETFVAWDSIRVTKAKYFLVGSSLELMQDNRLHYAVKSFNVSKFSGVEIEFRQGVPGCGKTYNFLKGCIPPTSLVTGDLVLFPTREGAEDFRNKIAKEHVLTSKQLRTNYRTMDSYLLHGDDTQFDTIMVDEALMVHVGQILYCAYKARAKKIVMIGDQRQIKFINRTPQCEIKHSDPSMFVLPSVHLSVSYRCTLTTAVLLSPLYGQGMQSTNRILGEMAFEKFLNLRSISKLYPDEQYLVFKQSEKNNLIKHGLTNTLTIHEYQGKQADHIVVVRTIAKKEDIYNSESHALVAISRHRKTFRYFSPVSNDRISKYITQSRSITQKQADVCFHSLKAGGVIRKYHFSTFDGNRVQHDNVFSCAEKYGFPNLPTLMVGYEQFTDQFPITTTVQGVNSRLLNASTLQGFYNYIFPGHSTHYYDKDPVLATLTDIDLNVECMKFNPRYRTKYKRETFDRMRPVLQTAIPASRPNSQLESLFAMIKRNQAVPDLAQVVDNEHLSEVMLDMFVNTYLVDDHKSYLSKFRTNPIRPNTYSISDWLATQPTGTVNLIEQKTFISSRDVSRYKFMIKSTVKPQLEMGAPFNYAALQTIAYHEKDVNAIFCPIFRELKDRVIPFLRNKFMVNIDMSHDEFVREVRLRLGPYAFDGKNRMEVDMSKYDKSQGRVMLMFETKLMRYFGVDEEYIQLWWNAHERTTLYDRDNKISCRVNFQRKSGDASTFVGNTFFLMAVLSTLFDLDNVNFGVFGGDDSLLIGGSEIDVDLNELCASLFNLESKFMRSYNYSYFCSKFLVQYRDNYLFVPDPVKLITKLGRRDLVNPEHVEQYRISLQDIVKPFGNSLYHNVISAAVNERYERSGCHSATFSTIYNIVYDKFAFHSLYFSKPEDQLNHDPSLPKFD